MTKKKLTYITILGACIAAGVFVTVPSQAVSDEGKSKAMIMLEKAKAARLERKKALENKRNEMEQYYSDKTGHKYKLNVFFEGEMVDSDALNQWVPNGYNAVLFSNNDSKAQKILVSNAEKMVTAYIDFTKEINEQNQIIHRMFSAKLPFIQVKIHQFVSLLFVTKIPIFLHLKVMNCIKMVL